MTVLVVLTVIVIVALIAGLAVYLYWAGTLLDRIGAKLEGAVRNTAPLAALRTTIEHATIIIAGLQRGRARLGG